jgi:hypothetical protein
MSFGTHHESEQPAATHPEPLLTENRIRRNRAILGQDAIPGQSPIGGQSGFVWQAPTLPPSRGARAHAREAAGNQRPWPADKVERWAIDRLIPYAKNARTHTDAQIAAIAASIKEWGWTTPALVGEDGGLIAGHARVLPGCSLPGSSASLTSR